MSLRRDKKILNKINSVSIVLVLCCVVGVLGYYYKDNIIDLKEETSKEKNIEEKAIEEVEEVIPEENIELAQVKEPETIDILSIGNVIVHQSQIDGAKNDNGYDFSPSFTYVEDMFSKPDLAIAVVESTLNGGIPTGYPNFNSPDEFIDNLKASGVDMINYASNHIYDYLDEGLMRTINVTKEKGLDVLGVQSDVGEKNYTIKEVKGQKIGFISYTYETQSQNGYKAINSNIVSPYTSECINSFDYSNLDSFYSQMENEIKLMKEDGAKFIISSIHWGEEYNTYESEYQIAIANKLNQLGVDIILGGHPHVIQPYRVVKNENGHETFVLYSQGNSLSNQSEEEIGIAESEDGILANFTLEVKDDKISLKEYKIIPTWVYKEAKDDGTFYHRIIPVEDAINNKEKYKLTYYAYERAKASLERTKSIIGNNYN